VTELAYPFEISLAAASKHVGQLERAGLVSRRVAGREHWISIAPARLGEAAGWLATYRAFWEQRLDALETLVTEPTDG